MRTIDIPVPDPSEWKGIDSYTVNEATGRVTLTPTEGESARLTIDYLATDIEYELTIKAAYGLTPSTFGTLILQNRASMFAGYFDISAARTFPIDPSLPVELVFTPAAGHSNTTFRYELTITATVPDAPARRPVPADELRLEAYVPRPGINGFILGTSRLDQDALNGGAPWPGTFILGTSKLSQAFLFQPKLVNEWRSILGPATSLKTRRGVTTDILTRAETGTLTAEYGNGGIDLRALGLSWGTPICLYHWPTRTPIFTGRLEDVQTVPQKPSRGRSQPAHVTLTAADSAAEAARTMRYGAIRGAGLTETWRARIDRLMTSLPDMPYEIVPAVTEYAPVMANTVHESTLTQHLDIAAASAGGAWWTSACGGYRFCPGTPAGDPIHHLADLGGDWSPVEADTSWSWGDLATAVTITNRNAVVGDSGWEAADTETTITDPTLTATYGYRATQVETSLQPTGGQVEALAARLTRGQRGAAPPRQMVLHALDRMAEASALDVMDAVTAEIRGEVQDVSLATVEHTITPKDWHTTIETIRRTT